MQQMQIQGNIDNEEEPKVTDKFEITAKTDEPKRKPSDFFTKVSTH